MEIKEASAPDFPRIMKLYKSTGWINYTDNPLMLEKAVQQSLKVLTAWEGGEMVGIIRAVGDGESVMLIQDIIVAPEHRRKGIGAQLLREMDSLYPHVYEKILLTDDLPRSLKFYEKCGFSESGKLRCVAMVKFHIS